MKLLKKYIERDRSVSLSFIASALYTDELIRDGSPFYHKRQAFNITQDEDLWHCYNLIGPGDEIRAPAIRRVVNTSSTGSTDSQRVRLTLTIRVEKTFFSPSATSTTEAAPGTSNQPPQNAQLQISGRVTSENPHVKLGAFHTLDLESLRDFKLGKGPGGWDTINIQRVEEASAEGAGAEVAAILIGEGNAAICLLTNHMTVVKQRIDAQIPRKRKGMSSAHEKATEKFHDQLTAAFVKHILPLSTNLRVILFAGSSFPRDSFLKTMLENAQHNGDKTILALRPKFLKVNTGSANVHALNEALKSPEVAAQLKDTKFAREGMMLDKFNKMLVTDENRAWYGPDHVQKAIDRGAVGTLLISDTLFRSQDIAERKRFVKMVEDVRELGGTEVLIFSAMHESGHKLDLLSGIAALLTYPLDIEMVEMEEEDEKAAQEAQQ
ncbi:hypothetical protein E3Q06_02353 [Wallemia mellicola]|nr:hypothetical protein E3Q21_02396 [Wallemia mellicola]TIB87613.1 hypothetical protein E3Q20_02360 [Wallemia mellicola]TIC40045.1 hypothetical protein E3Q07_02376 [Wallemia mellicola]TIC48468.1 hypothetical protein E3Q06_02353 [Wallemia mellicola]TIC54835.1 hypothetical protein E3Q04_02134 [Wallemia mellicola]